LEAVRLVTLPSNPNLGTIAEHSVIQSCVTIGSCLMSALPLSTGPIEKDGNQLFGTDLKPAAYMLYPKNSKLSLFQDTPHIKEKIKPDSERERLERKGGIVMPLPFSIGKAEIRNWEDRLNCLPILARLGGRFDLSDPYITQVHIDEVQAYHLGGMGISALRPRFERSVKLT